MMGLFIQVGAAHLTAFIIAYYCNAPCSGLHQDNICGNSNGRRLYLELGERGALTAINVTSTFAPHLQQTNSGGNMSSHEQCGLELVTCPACIVSVTFHHLDLPHHCGGGNMLMDSPCRCDYVWLSEPPYEDQSGVPFCGLLASIGNSPLKYRSQTRSLAISLLYSETHKHAFTLEYTAERNRHYIKGSPGDGSVVSPSSNVSHSGVLASPFFPSQYPRDLGIEYVVTCQPDSTNTSSCRVRIVFRDFQLASASIMEFYDWNGHRLDVSSGSLFRPPVILTTGPSMLVRFYANGGTGSGFKAIYSFVTENFQESAIIPVTDCGGYVENLGGAITMMNMVQHGVKTYDCVWLIRPPKNYLHLRTHLLLKVATFKDMAGSTELQVLQGQTSETPILEILRHPAAHAQSSSHREHVVPINVGFYVSLRGTFGPHSRLAIVYTAFSYMDCFTGPDFLCQNHRCIPSQLSCDGFDHCGDNSDEPNTCYQDWEAEPQDRRWYSHTPNYFFPKMERYPDLKTATLIFIVCSLGLILLIVALMILLYRMGARARQQREIQNRLQTISELLDGARIDEAGPPDDPPVYEAPPDYDEVIKVFLEPIDCQRQKKKKCQLPRRGRSTRRSRSTQRNTPRNGNIPVANEQCCTQPAALLEVTLPNPVACSTPSLHASSGPSQLSCGITSRSCQTTPIPDSPPPPYADATHSVTPGPSSHQQMISPHDTSRKCKSDRLSKRGRTLRQSWLLFRQESAQDQLLSVVITGVGCPPVDQDTNDAFQPAIAIPNYKLLTPLTENGLFSNCSPTLFHPDKLNRMNHREEVDPQSVTNLISIEEASSSQSLSPNLTDDFSISQMISMENGKTSMRRETMLEVKHLQRNFISFDDLITEGIRHSILPMRQEDLTANFPTLINRRCSSHNSVGLCPQSAPSREFSSDSELDSNRKRTSINVRSSRVHPQIGRDIGLFVENKEMAVKELTKNRSPIDGNLTNNICSSSISNCECEGACGCATIDNHTNLKSNVNKKGKHKRSLSAGFPSTSSSSPRSRHLRELDIYFSQHEVGFKQLTTPVLPLQNCNTSGDQINADKWQTDSRSIWEILEGNIITQT
ncbi:uncharacterized protein Culd isoform X2 [Periplaneta americana]|uniref:uncharacterized protein Culd isoform X2 n=1 Tax=Periplaneta americana TaxID=6978 RepID=UPI0037E7CD7A